MTPETYTSLAAFLAHWRMLRHASADALAADELARSAEMEKIIAVAAARGARRPGGRESERRRPIQMTGLRTAAPRARHRERAELRLARELRTRGMLAI